MNILTYLQELDKLIIDHTQPPVTGMLRNKLSLALEQAEAHTDAVANQGKTLATQIQTIERLMKEKADTDTKLAALEKENAELKTAKRNATWDTLQKKSEDCHRMLQDKELRYDV